MGEEDVRLIALQLKPIIKEANVELMKTFDIDLDNVESITRQRDDFRFLRKRRKRSESIVDKSLLASVGVCAIAAVNWVLDKISFGGL